MREKEQYLSEWNDIFEKIVDLSDKQRGVKPAKTKITKKRRLDKLLAEVGVTKSVKPARLAKTLMLYVKYKYEAEEIHEYDRYGVPIGTDVVSYEDDEIPEKYHLGDPPILFPKGGTAGGGYKKNSRFNVWIRTVLLPRRPDIRAKLDAIDDTKKRNNAFKRLSYVLRRAIAERGIIPNAYGIYDKNEKLVGLKYNSGKVYKIKRRRW